MTTSESTGIQRVMEWRKRKFEDEEREVKRPRYVYFRLESESSVPSDEDTESIDSIQGKETELCCDTSDTESRSSDPSDIEIEVEYEVASLSDNDFLAGDFSSSGDDDLQTAAGTVAAMLYNGTLDALATDGETSDKSSLGEANISFIDVRKDFWTCVQCKSDNSNPQYPYCERCFQQRCWHCKTAKNYKCFPLCESCFKVKKTMYPPRPRGTRKRKLDKKQEPRVKLDTLQSCLKSLSQDSGLGSSQELPPLDLNKIVVPEHLKRSSSTLTAIDEDDEPPLKSRKVGPPSPQPEDETRSDCTLKQDELSSKSDVDSVRPDSSKSDSGVSGFVNTRHDKDDNAGHDNGKVTNSEESRREKELCILCFEKPRDSVFLHGSIGHICCCYKCAKRTWASSKRCPMCNCKVNNIVKVYSN